MTLDKKWTDFIHGYKDESLACITSLMYHNGFTGLKYQELRKEVFKELQRIDSQRHKNKVLAL